MEESQLSEDPVEIFDADFDAIKDELITVHKNLCESDQEPCIWVDASHAWSDGRNIYVAAECQNCMKGSDRTAVREDPKFHIKKIEAKTRRHS